MSCCKSFEFSTIKMLTKKKKEKKERPESGMSAIDNGRSPIPFLPFKG